MVNLMVNFLFRFLLTFNATSLLLIIFLVKKCEVLGKLIPAFAQFNFPNFISYIAYLFVPIALTGVSIFFSSYLGKDEFKKGEIESIAHANNSFLPSYLGYFFVALGIDSWDVMWFVYFVLFVFTFLSQALYFNPLFLLFGYEFYNIKTKNGTAVFLISRHQYKQPSDIEIATAYRINNYTFIEKD